jgi:hypothetical protein
MYFQDKHFYLFQKGTYENSPKSKRVKGIFELIETIRDSIGRMLE